MRTIRATQQHRFPRTNGDNPDLVYMSKIRRKYPPPAYNPKRDGSYDPADTVIKAGLSQKKKKLRKLCRRHGLDYTGNKQKLMKRMYLHWRDMKFFLFNENVNDYPWAGYGPGYERVNPPQCTCGSRQRFEERKKKAFHDDGIRRFPRHPRFPRTKKGRKS